MFQLTRGLSVSMYCVVWVLEWPKYVWLFQRSGWFGMQVDWVFFLSHGPCGLLCFIGLNDLGI